MLKMDPLNLQLDFKGVEFIYLLMKKGEMILEDLAKQSLF
jgi:hypothetical protein